MATLDSLFIEYLGLIQPSDKAVGRAKSAHEPLREALEQDETFGPYVYKSLLSGSYGRDTSIFSIKDVDVIILTTFTHADLQVKKHKDETEQRCLLRLTIEAIRRTGRTAEEKPARRSIYVELPAEINELDKKNPDLTMDIVPVLAGPFLDSDPMEIGDRELSGWYPTYPLTQLGDSKTRNSASNIIVDRHSYKPLAKMFRAWRRVHFNGKKTPKGFILECLTAQYHNPAAEHWGEAVRDLFRNICNAYPQPEYLTYIPTVRDISNSNPEPLPIAKTVEESKRVLKKIHDHLALVDEALTEAESDVTKSAKTLQRVFGQDCDDICFPLPDDDGGGSEKSRGPSPFNVIKTKSDSDVREAPPFG